MRVYYFRAASGLWSATAHLISLLLLLLVMAHPAWAAKEAGKILRIKGDVFVEDSSGKIVGATKATRGRRELKSGAPIYVGELVKTRGSGRVKIQFNQAGKNGKNDIVLGANTSLLIEDVSENDGKKKTSLELLKGEARSNVRAKYSGEGNDVYEIRTKNAVAGVRGTIFTAITDGKAISEFATERGAIDVTHLSQGAKVGAAVRVGAGMFTQSIGQQLKPAAPMQNNPDLQAKVQNLATGEERSPASDDSSKPGLDSQQEVSPRSEGSQETPTTSTPTNEEAPPVVKAPLYREKDRSEGDALSQQNDAGNFGLREPATEEAQIIGLKQKASAANDSAVDFKGAHPKLDPSRTLENLKDLNRATKNIKDLKNSLENAPATVKIKFPE